MEPQIRIDRVQQRMDDLGIESGRQLAALGDADHVTMNKLLKQQSPRVSLLTVVRLAKALQCSVDYLLGLVDDPKSQGMALPEMGEEMLRLLDSLPPLRREELIRVGGVMAEFEQRRAQEVADFESVISILQARMTPDEFAEIEELLRAATVTDAAAWSDIVARQRAAQTPPGEAAEK